MKGGIVYISSNREKPKFEQKIIKDMLSKKGDLPIFSVTQQPMNLGANQFVGDVGVSGFNFCRQLQMAVKMADVDYVISCEADCLYPKDYFTFVPPKPDKIYRNNNNYLIPYKRNVYWYKKSQTAFQIASKKVLLARLDYLLDGQPMWNTKMKNFPKEIGKKFLGSWHEFTTINACLTIKTGDGMRNYSNSERFNIDELPYWGTAIKIKRRFL